MSVCRRGVLLALVLALAGCGDDGDGVDTDGPPTFTGPMEVSSTTVHPGDTVAVTLADDRIVTGDFSLAVWDGSGWIYQYQLFGSPSDADDGTQRWRTWSERTASFPDVSLGGGEPFYLVMPSHAISGGYRLCAQATDPLVCTGLTLAD